MVTIRYLDAPRADPTATEALRHLTATLRTQPRLPTLRRTPRERLTATIAECLHAKGSTHERPADFRKFQCFD